MKPSSASHGNVKRSNQISARIPSSAPARSASDPAIRARREMRSANSPAGMANRTNGSVSAVCSAPVRPSPTPSVSTATMGAAASATCSADCAARLDHAIRLKVGGSGSCRNPAMAHLLLFVLGRMRADPSANHPVSGPIPARCRCKLVATSAQIGHPADMDAISPKPAAASEASAAPIASGWPRRDSEGPRSLSEVNASVAIPLGGHWFRRLLAFAGPGYLVSVGYMDPGNWATDLAGGAQFGYTLLSVILLSNVMAILLQALAARLGIVTDRDLAQACRDSYSRPVNIMLWLACEAAIIACDLAEVIGTAIALQLLFGIPLIGGALIAALDAFLLLLLMNKGFRFLEAFVI